MVLRGSVLRMRHIHPEIGSTAVLSGWAWFVGGSGKYDCKEVA